QPADFLNCSVRHDYAICMSELIDTGARHGDLRHVVGGAGIVRYPQGEEVTATVDQPADRAIGRPDASLEVAAAELLRPRPDGGNSMGRMQAAHGLRPAPHG